jgi:hypothetical protein
MIIRDFAPLVAMLIPSILLVMAAAATILPL